MKTFLEVGPGGCRWPVARSDDGAHLFCAEPADGSYCAEHRRLAYPDAKPSKRRDALPFSRIGLRPVVWFEPNTFRGDFAKVLGGRSPLTRPKHEQVIGAHGKRVDEDGHETAGHEPDLVELFGLAR